MTVNVTRRTAMSGGAVGLAAAGASLRGTSASAYAPATIVVEESAVPESRQFAEAFVTAGHAARVIRIDRSLNGLLYRLEDFGCRFAGLTSDPAAMIAAQLLVERGGRPLLQWTHHYDGRAWSHITAGAPTLLRRANHGWPTALAHHVRDKLDFQESESMAKCRSGFCGLPASSPGTLVSWVIEMRENQS
ncbi:hypothetical protein ACWPMX_11570 [Tsuneonella sp. HG094]